MHMLQQNFSEEPYKIIKERAAFLKKWTLRCKELQSSEKDLHKGLEPHIQDVLKGKRLLLFKEILMDLNYPDKTLIDEICQGFNLSGWLPKSTVFPPSLKRPAHSMDSVRNMAKGLNKSICKQVAGNTDAELAREVWDLTLEELSKGWARLDDECQGDQRILAKRFGLRQGSKVRLVDDCSIGGFNSTCEQGSKNGM